MNLWNWQRLENWLTQTTRNTSRRRTRRALPAHAEMLESRALLSTLTVTTLDDTNVNGDGQLSLREALTVANSNSAAVTIDGVSSADNADNIVFASGLNGTISLAGGQLSVAAPVSIDGNQAVTIDAHQASRIFNVTATAGAVSLSGLSLVNGRATVGGGGAVQTAVGSIVTISGSTLSGNSTTGAGVNGGAVSSAGSLNIIGSTLNNNFTVGANSDGGAIAASGALAVANSTLTGNFTTTATADGGAIYATGATVSLSNDTIDLNDAGGVGGGVNVSGIATINNTIIAQNSAGTSTDLEIIEATTTLNNSLIGSNAGTTLTAAASADANGNLIGTPSATIDAGLGTLANNGGTVQTQALLSGSAARDAGNIAFALDPFGVTLGTDARGTGFLRTDGVADIGAFEVQSGVNLAPVNILPAAQTIVANTNLTFSAATGTALTIGDADAGGKPVQVTLAGTNGTVTLSQVTGLTFTGGDGTADATMTFTGSLANINAALDGAFFTPTAAFTGAASVQVATSDRGNTGTGGPLTDSDTLAITVAAAGTNLAPVITRPTTTVSATVGTPLSFDASTGTISISDNDASGNLRVALAATHGTLTLGDTTGLTFTTGDGTADTSVTFTGTLAAINAALGTLSFSSNGSYQGPATVIVNVDDLSGTGTATAASTVNLNVAAQNIAPVNTLPGTQTVTTGGTLSFTTGNGNLISVADADAAGNPVQVTLTATNGTVSLGTLAGLTFTTGDGTADATTTFTGTVANVNAALAGLSFTATPAFTGTATLQVSTNDQGNTGTGGAQVDTDLLTILVANANVAPVNTLPATLSVATGGTVAFTGGNSISIADTDAGTNPVSVTLVATNGTVTLGQTTGLTFSTGDGTADTTLSFTGTLANINAALAGGSFTANTGFNGNATLTLVTNDQGSTGTGGARVDVDTSVITVAPAAANQAPVNSLPGAQTIGANGTLAFGAAAGTSGLGGPWTITGEPTFIRVNGSQITFTNERGGVSAGVINSPTSITATDWGLTGTVSDNGKTITWSNKSVWLRTTPISTTALSVADPDAGQTLLQVTIAVTNGTFSLSRTTGLTFTTGDGTHDSSVTFTGTLTSINAALQGSSFLASHGVSGPATLTITTNDQASNGPLTDTDTMTINVSASAQSDLTGAWSINSQPTSITENSGILTFTNERGESASGRFISATQVIADSWSGLRGTVSSDGNTISWENNSVWVRTVSRAATSGTPATPGNVFVPPHLAQNWSIFIDGRNQATQVITNSPQNLTFVNENNARSAGTFVSANRVFASDWNLYGDLNSNGTDIMWENHTEWMTDTPATPGVDSSMLAAMDSAFADPVMTSPA